MQHSHRPKTGTQTTHLAPLLAILLLTVAGCGGGGGGGTPTPPPPTPTTPVARFAYVANFGDDTVSVLIADNTTGRLMHHGYVQTGDGPTDLVIDPSGQFAYTLNGNSTDISLFTVDSLSGELVAADCNQSTGSLDTCSTGGTPVSMAFEPNGQFAYVVNQTSNNLTAHAKDTVTGALSDVATQPPVDVTADGGDTPVKLRVHPNGGFLYVAYDATDNVGVYQIDAIDGTLTHVTGSPVASGGTAASDIAITPNGQYAYVANQSGEIGVFTIDGSGLLVPNGSPLLAGGAPTPYALAIESSGRWLYMLSQEVSGSVSLFEIQSDGTLVQRDCGTSQTCPAGSVPESITIDPTGQFIAVTNRNDDTIDRFTINQTDGSLTNQRTLASRDIPSGIVYLQDTSAVSITPRFAYVAHEVSNSVTGFTINANSGALSSIGTVTPGNVPTSVTADPSGRFVYVTTSGDDAISAYTVNSSTGVLSQIGSTSTALLQSDPIAIAVEPSGRFLYIANTGSDSISIYEINTNSGALTQVGSPVTMTAGANPTDLVTDPTGRYLYVTNSNQTFDDIRSYTIDPTDGTLTLNEASVTGTNMDGPTSITIDATGRFLYTANANLVASRCWISGFEIASNTGTLTELTNSPFSTETATSFNCNPTSIAADPLGDYLYAAATTDRIIAYTMDPLSGDLTLSSNVFASNDPYSLAITASGSYLYSANYWGQDVSAFTISASDGSLSEISSSPITTGGSGPISITTVSAIQ
ncbi:MAG: beta-propeller fold lactonase family protein [Candidatus Thiodiazotropha sp.]